MVEKNVKFPLPTDFTGFRFQRKLTVMLCHRNLTDSELPIKFTQRYKCTNVTSKSKITKMKAHVGDMCNMGDTYNQCHISWTLAAVYTLNAGAFRVAPYCTMQPYSQSEWSNPRFNTMWVLYTNSIHSHSRETAVCAKHFKKIQKTEISLVEGAAFFRRETQKSQLQYYRKNQNFQERGTQKRPLLEQGE